MHPDVLTLQEAAQVLGVSTATVRRRTMAGDVPGGKIAREWRFWRPAIMALLTGQDDDTVLEPEGISLPEFAARVGLSETAVRRNCRQGRIAAIQIGTRWRFYWPSVVEALQERRVHVEDAPADETPLP